MLLRARNFVSKKSAISAAMSMAFPPFGILITWRRKITGCKQKSASASGLTRHLASFIPSPPETYASENQHRPSNYYAPGRKTDNLGQKTDRETDRRTARETETDFVLADCVENRISDNDNDGGSYSSGDLVLAPRYRRRSFAAVGVGGGGSSCWPWRESSVFKTRSPTNAGRNCTELETLKARKPNETKRKFYGSS